MEGVGVVREGGRIRPGNAPRVTLRDTQGVTPGITGVLADIKGGRMENLRRIKRLDRTAKREDQLVSYVTGARHTTADRAHMGSVAQRQGLEHVVHATPTVATATYNERLGSRTSTYNKLPSSNPRLDLRIAAEQLKSNPFRPSVSLWEA
jgi:hypothetical protein